MAWRHTERVYGEEGGTGPFEVHRRVLTGDDGEVRDSVFVTFPNSRHEVWGWEDLTALKKALDKFFDAEERLGAGESAGE